MKLPSPTTQLFFLSLVTACHLSLATAASPQFDIEKVDEVFADYRDIHAPCCTMAVYRNGEILLSRSYGFANLEYDVPNSADTVFHIASVSKQFTALSILLLEDEQKLSLDDDIRDYLTEMPDFGEVITIRNLLNHTSGIRDQWDLLTLAGYRTDDLKTNDDIYRLLTRQQALNFTPGERFLYSNSGYTLLALIVERVSGQTFREYTQERIFDPLGMNSTHFHDNHNEVVPNRSYGYVQGPDQNFQLSIPVFNTVGATGLFTTANDFARWDRNFEEHIVGNDEVFAKMLTLGRLNNGQQISYASGLGITEYKGLKMISHTGADPGYRSTYMRFPDEEISVVVFANAHVDAGGLGVKVADLILADSMQDPFLNAAETTTDADSIEVSDEISEKRTGPYRDNESSITWDIVHRPQSKSLVLVADDVSFDIRPTDNDTYIATDSSNNVKVIFTNEAENSPAIQVFFDDQIMFRGTRVPLIQDIETYSKAISGSYYSQELDVRYTVKMIDERLVIQHFKLPEIRLIAVYEDVLASESGLLNLRFERDEEGIVSGFRASTRRAINLEFVKED